MNKTVNQYGSWAVVTGASDGIGKAFAQAIAANGMNVFLVARTKGQLDELSVELALRYKVKTAVIVADLSIMEGVDAVLDHTKESDVGLYVGAAGFGTSGDFIDTSIESELNMVDLNCKSIVKHAQVYAQRFKKRGSGGIILLSSLVGFQGTPRASNYAATKAFVQTLAEGLHVELKPHKIDVLAVAPGPVKSGFADRANMIMANTDSPQIVAQHALKRLGKCFTTRPGFLGKLLGYSLSMTPRWGRVQILTRVMGDMTKHNVHSGTRQHEAG